MKIRVNGVDHDVTVDSSTPLLWMIREQLRLTGTKYSCGIGECGACTVLVDGEPTLACQTSVDEVVGRQVVTIEGLSDATGEAVKSAWVAEQVPQCGYCQPGQIMTATALLQGTPSPSNADIDDAMSPVLCRCGTYPAIRRAIHRAAKR